MAYQFIDIGVDAICVYDLSSAESRRINSSNLKEDSNFILAFQNLIEGGTILDRSSYARIKTAGLNDSIHSPFVKVTLPAGKFERGGKIYSAAGIGFGNNGERLMHFSNGHPNYDHDDRVAIDVYCAYWTAKGAIVGHKDQNKIVWNNGNTLIFENK